MTTTAPILTPATSTSAGLVLGILSLRRESSGRGLAVGGIVTSGVTLTGGFVAALAALALLPFVAIGALWG
ncbi:MAG: hypothetical protein H7226_01650 [Salinibacterium sp.]|nr:hypothetical protein [Salinibacterium sp.]